jgi:hypothetical protein
VLGKSFRIELATDITRRVEKLEWDVRALTLSQFGLQDTDGDRFSPSLLEVVGTATDEVLADLGEHFVACQRDGTTSLPRAWDHLEVLVSITGPWFRCQRRRAG